jgi:hypothetical protein
MTFHIHITQHEIHAGLGVVSHLAGNSVLGNGAAAISHESDALVFGVDVLCWIRGEIVGAFLAEIKRERMMQPPQG